MSERDAAWVVVETAWPVECLGQFLDGVQRLYRINPFLEFMRWEEGEQGFAAELFNHSNGQRLQLDARVTREAALALRVDYAQGVKCSTRFVVEPSSGGSRLTVTEEYAPDAPAAPEQVDRSLHAWGVALKDYLARERRWGHWPLYRWFMARIWLPMKPAARRITFLMLVISVADVALITLGLAIYWLEAAR